MHLKVYLWLGRRFILPCILISCFLASCSAANEFPTWWLATFVYCPEAKRENEKTLEELQQALSSRPYGELLYSTSEDVAEQELNNGFSYRYLAAPKVASEIDRGRTQILLRFPRLCATALYSGDLHERVCCRREDPKVVIIELSELDGSSSAGISEDELWGGFSQEWLEEVERAVLHNRVTARIRLAEERDVPFTLSIVREIHRKNAKVIRIREIYHMRDSHSPEYSFSIYGRPFPVGGIYCSNMELLDFDELIYSGLVE